MMNEICPFCNTEVRKIGVHFDLRICPHCFSTFFPTNRTMSFRSELFALTRKKWLLALKAKNLPSVTENVKCIFHGDMLVDGALPDYGILGKVTTCCGTFHLTAKMTMEILERTLASESVKTNERHHFAFIRALYKIIDRLIGNEEFKEDPIEAIQYELHFKSVLEP